MGTRAGDRRGRTSAVAAALSLLLAVLALGPAPAAAQLDETLEGIEPVVDVSAPGDGIHGGEVDVEWTTVDTDPATVRIEFLPQDDGSAILIDDQEKDDGHYRWNTTTVPDGQGRVRVTAVDERGHEGSDTSDTITVDNDPPVVRIQGIADGAVLNRTPERIEGTAVDAGSGTKQVQVVLHHAQDNRYYRAEDGSSGPYWQDAKVRNDVGGTDSWAWELDALEPGVYEVTVYATDKIGREGEASVAFEIVGPDDPTDVDDLEALLGDDDGDGDGGDGDEAAGIFDEDDLGDAPSVVQAPDGVLDAADVHRTVTGVRAGAEVLVPLADPALTGVRFTLEADRPAVTLVVQRVGPDELAAGDVPPLPRGVTVYRAFDVDLYADGARLDDAAIASVRLTVRVDDAFRASHDLDGLTPAWYHHHDGAWQRLDAVADLDRAWTYHGDAEGLSPFAFGFETQGAAVGADLTSVALAVFYLAVIGVSIGVLVASRRHGWPHWEEWTGEDDEP